tara:strand:- start:2439 stop:3644 length:1206 start_codon:yes stop_codon:yes gene_type:complete
MESVRSPPSAESASDAVGELPSSAAVEAVDEVIEQHDVREERSATVGDLKRASHEGYSLSSCVGVRPLYLRRLVLAAQKRERSTNGIRKQRLSAKASKLTSSIGTIFGSTLKSILEFSGVQPTKAESLRALRHLVRFLTPAACAVASVGGADRLHVANGLGVHRVSSKQARMLPESHEAQSGRSFLGRNGLRDIAFGATAALLTSHYVMRALGHDATIVADNLQRSARAVDELLGQWPVKSGDIGVGDWNMHSLRAEARAIRRARAAALAAASLAEAQGLSRSAALQLQFQWMRAAAWPRGTVCDAENHSYVCEQLAAGKQVGDPYAEALPLPSLPLSALQSCTAAWLDTGRGDDSSEDGASSRSGSSWASSSASSVGSVGSVGSVNGDGACEVMRLLSEL